MAYKSDDYKPNAKGRAILARAAAHVASVPYRVTARWLFYRLLQDGLYSKKQDYKTFLALTSRARHNEWESWRPDTLADDTRERIIRGEGYESADDWRDMLTQRAYCELDKWTSQAYYVQIWFEANAMAGQFKHYTRHITLVPFGGMPSIPYKWEIAEALSDAGDFCGLPIKVLYFGDYDPAGLTILETSAIDIAGWCDADFEVERVGLNVGDGERYGIPENPDKPGQYQWEALPDEAARELIAGAVGRYIDADAMAKMEEREAKISASFRKYVAGWNPD